ncbi:MAG: tetratricopeptide repeat protein [Pseudolabrys sp.]|nr:tetratricopeptide repeat protein [Pseudolabrys sp.]
MSTRRRLTTAGIFALAALMSAAFVVKPAAAMGTDNPPSSDDKKDKKKKGSELRQEDKAKAYAEFLQDYRAAREQILAGNYEQGIKMMHALGDDDHPDVANYIGYANRKMGNYDDSKYWYEKALAADPNHVRTWSYYGMWQAEQGNRLKAEDYLAKVKLICGNATCEEYTQLKAVIDGKASY